MLSSIVRFSIRHYGIIICLSVLLMAYGGYRYMHAGLDIFPEFSPKQVIIQTEASGYTAEQVEILVTQPIEMSLNGLMNLTILRSESIQGLSIVTATFSENTDIYRNRQLVTERLSGLSGVLPDDIKPPVPAPLSSSSATVLTIGLHSDSKTLMQLRSLVDWTIVPRLLSVTGVADINVFGGQVKQLQIQFKPTQLQRFNVSINEIIAAAKNATSFMGSGFIENSNQRFSIQLTGQAATPEQLANVVIYPQQSPPLTLGEVADIQYAPEAKISAAQIQGKPGIVMMVIGQYGANTLSVSQALETALNEFNTLFRKQGINFYSSLFRPADYIESSVHNLSGHLLIGGCFVLLVLYVFLYNFRVACIAAIAIPLSLICAIIILLQCGVNLNIMVLGGLAIALGEVVDDAIIDTENILRRLHENQNSATPINPQQVIHAAAMEVRGSVVYASFIVALVFVPLLTLSGVAGRLFAPLGYSYILAILMSLLVALTLTPALCRLLLKGKALSAPPPTHIQLLKKYYLSVLKLCTRLQTPLLLSVFALTSLSLFGLSNLGSRFLPELREGHYIVHTTSLPGTSLQESIRTGILLSQKFRDIPGVISVSQWAGRAERGADTYGSHYSEFEVRLNPASGSEQQEILEALRTTLQSFPGILFEANTFLTERIDETVSGYTSPIVINVYGDNLDELDVYAKRVAHIIQNTDGAEQVQIRSPAKTPILKVQLKQQQLKFYGIQTQQVLEALHAAFTGKITGKFLQGNRVFNISVTLTEDLKKQVESIKAIPLRSGKQQLIPLQQLADISLAEGRYNILHQNAQRKQAVTANVSNRDLQSFMDEIQMRILQEIDFPLHIYPEFTGTAIEQQKARQQLILHSLLSASGVCLLIFMAIGNFTHVALTLLNLPFALLGGLWVVLFTGIPLSIGSVVGFITLFGITVRNTIMLLSHYQHLTEKEGKPWNLQTMLLGAEQRLPSILMTALVTALAMTPIAFNSDNPGREILGPMAAIIIGGLATSTLLNLLILPGIMLRYGRFECIADE